MRFRAIAFGLTLVGLIFAVPSHLLAYTGEKLAKGAKVSIEEARAIALKAQPGTISDEELEREGGGSGLRYSFDITSGGVKYEVGVDAQLARFSKTRRRDVTQIRSTIRYNVAAASVVLGITAQCKNGVTKRSPKDKSNRSSPGSQPAEHDGRDVPNRDHGYSDHGLIEKSDGLGSARGIVQSAIRLCVN